MHTDSTPKGDLTKLQRNTMTEADARAMLERIRWPNGLACIFCGTMDVGRIEAKASTRQRVNAKGETVEALVPARHLFKCKACKKQFSVTKGTIFEDSKIPLQVWITVMFRMCSSKKGISAHQLHREYGLSYETAWFMAHRIRWAMSEKNPTPLAGVVEADETYVGGKLRGHAGQRAKKMNMSQRIKAASDKKTQVFGMLERGGRVRAQAMPVKGKRITQKQVQGVILENIDAKATQLITDEYDYYFGMEKHMPHGIIRHKSEYVRGDVHTQGIEGFWSGLKRQLEATHHHVDAAYLNMYVQEQAFRYNARKITDGERWATLMGQVDGRLDWYVGKNAGEPS